MKITTRCSNWIGLVKWKMSHGNLKWIISAFLLGQENAMTCGQVIIPNTWPLTTRETSLAGSGSSNFVQSSLLGMNASIDRPGTISTTTNFCSRGTLLVGMIGPMMVLLGNCWAYTLTTNTAMHLWRHKESDEHLSRWDKPSSTHNNNGTWWL